MKLYDTINGTFVSDMECSISEVRVEVYQGKYSEHELENWTLEGNQESTDSTQLADLKEVAYFYASGDSGSIIACSDGRHVDTVWSNGVWDNGELLKRDNCDTHFEQMMAEMEAFEKSGIELDESLKAKLQAESTEFAHNCVNYDIADKHSTFEDAINEYVGT